jgi:hypothetical protein
MICRTELLKEFGSDYFIRQKVKSGEINKIGKAVYAKEKNVPESAYFAFKYPHAIFTMHTAFYMHGLTDVIPEGYDLATDRNASKIRDKRVKQYFVASDFVNLGVEKMIYNGYPIKIYSKERMLIELIRYKTKLPYDYYKEIVLNYRKLMPKLNIQDIQDYALKAPKSSKIMEILQSEVM